MEFGEGGGEAGEGGQFLEREGEREEEREEEREGLVEEETVTVSDVTVS